MKQKFSWLISAMLLGVIVLFSFNPNTFAATTLTEDEKKQYYQEYLKIAEELRVEYPDAFNFEVTNFEDFKDRDWVEPEQYRKTIIPIINGKIEVSDVAPPSIDVVPSFTILGASATPTKYASVKNSSGNTIGTVVINATVSTQHKASAGGQVISGISGVSSYTMDILADWAQTGASTVKVNDRKWDLKVAGKYAQSGVIISDILVVSYSCDAYGAIF